MRVAVILLVLSGCSRVNSAGDAPFTIGTVKAALWAPYSSNGSTSEEVLLVLSNRELDCSVLEGKTPDNAVLAATIEGEGLVFGLSQRRNEEGPGFAGWEGLYSQSGSSMESTDGYVRRGFDAHGFSDGFLVPAFSYQDPAWMRVEKAESGEARGTYFTQWWRGSFDADICGVINDETEDTGWW